MLTWTAEWAAGRPGYPGAVLATGGTRSIRVMSDVWGTEEYATVWTGERIEHVVVALGDDMGYRRYATVTVDATSETLAAATAWLAAHYAAEHKADFDRWTDRLAREAHRIERGKAVLVARGRKVAKGTTGEVFWVGHGRFGLRAGVRDAAGVVHWTAASNLDVLNPDEWMPVEALTPPTPAESAAHGAARVAAIAAGAGPTDDLSGWLAGSTLALAV